MKILDRANITSATAARRPAGMAFVAAALAGAAAFSQGCANMRLTDPPRTATEQFLMSTAAVKAVEQLSFEALRGRKVFVDSTYFPADQKGFVLGEVRAKCLDEGVQLMPQRDEAQIVLEVRSGSVGIDRKEFLVGVPQFLPSATGSGDLDSGLPLVAPELAFLKNIEQKGYANVVFVAYWAASGEIVTRSPSATGQTLRDDWWFFGFGPRTVGNIPTVEQAQD